MFLLIDIDNTLYKYSETGFDTVIKSLIVKFIRECTDLSMETMKTLPWEHYLSNGISLLEFLKDHGVSAKDFTDYMHQCSYHKIKVNVHLEDMLNRLKGADYVTTRSDEKDDHILVNGAYASSTSAIDCGDGKRHYLYFFTNANRSHARRILESLGLRSVFTRQRQTASLNQYYHYSYDMDGYEEDVDWVGFSYEDQWRLTEPEITNKPARRAYEAIYRALEEDIMRDEMQWGVAPSITNFPSLDAEPVAMTDDLPSLLKKEVPSGKNDEVDEVETYESWDQKHRAERARRLLLHKRMNLHPDRIAMVDDSLTNLREPLLLGWKAVWCVPGGETLPDEEPYQEAYRNGSLKIIHDILELEKVINAWDDEF
ncbi:unnamed protein product [Phytomonas sp. EM1]|nr:unnamed protein product [Phytomonas sp. EM1]|eukprot:CCW60077.1 unnamed protein product [Phytomonas sp. isolate EM1]